MRSILHFALFVPALAGAALYTGTVSSLENHPLAGVVVKLGSDSVATGHDGTWSLSRTAGIQARDAQAIDGTRHLVRDGSRLSLAWEDHDILGRGPAMRKSLPSNQRTTIGARTMAATSTDTIVIRWKGKSLSRIPVSPSDTTIAQAIDTSWKDDAGIPWNPSIAYGSLPDTRDGQTYRTTKIGTQTWMAENLNFKVDSSWCNNSNLEAKVRNCEPYGRLYRWTASMALDPKYDSVGWRGNTLPHKGICPSGWHVPDESEWEDLLRKVDSNPQVPRLHGGAALMSKGGWEAPIDSIIGPDSLGLGVYSGLDLFGFRILPAGDRYWDGRFFEGLGYKARFWTSSESEQGTTDAWFWTQNIGYGYMFQGRYYKSHGFSLRCLKDPL